MQPKPLLEVDRLTKTYAGAHGTLTVLSEVSFSLAAGETCSIVGPSGSGKTTLLGLCAGLDRPSSGDVRVDGDSLGSLDEEALARFRSERVGFIFQSFQLLPMLTALENVMVPLELRGAPNPRGPAEDLLRTVGLADRQDHYPAQLSGGEQQRVAIARAFVNKPRVLFADEPTGNLDQETAQRVVDMLFELNASSQTALVLVTHNLELAAKAHQVIRLRGGRRVEVA
ncbi:MAG: ABC transporter ATP-binding protein [Verrucomicrobia bacterium]|nr:ABC transporter ATP-binding protein [Verrucomicrobiota bacterium]MBI3868180.1 ABC transporter ATP-binding protein [Verrucomicrobiota bacterium]